MDQYHSHLKWIEKERAVIITTLEKWSNIHSGSNHLSGLAEMMDELKEAFSPLEGEIKEISLSPRKTLTIEGSLSEEPLGQALFISRNPDAPTQILLGGHMDIAYPAHLPLSKCYRSSRDVLIGRGTADMKSGLLIMLLALKSLEQSPFTGKIGWKLLITPDEEIGSPGSLPLFLETAKQCDLGLIFEPAFPDGSLAGARSGSANYLIAVKGKSAHVGRDFESGHNALASAARLALAAEYLSDIFEGITVNIGYLQGGGPLNIVPDKAICGINIRAKGTDIFNLVKEKLKSLAEMENRRGGISLILHQESDRPPKLFNHKTRLLFEALKRSGKMLDVNISWKASGGVCDGNNLAHAGLPTIDTLGGVGGKLHTSEEYVSISSIIVRAKVAARFLMQIAAGEIIIK